MQAEELRAELAKTKAELEEVSEELQEALKQLRKTEVEQEEQLQGWAYRCMSTPHAWPHILAVYSHLSNSASCLLHLHFSHMPLTSFQAPWFCALCSACHEIFNHGRVQPTCPQELVGQSASALALPLPEGLRSRGRV